MRAIAACGLAVVTLCGASLAPVHAADLSYPAPPVYSEPDPQAEFGTGWYLRGDVGWGDTTREKLFGLVPDLTSNSDWTGGVGAGYRWNEWFRTDLSVNFDGYQHLSNTVDNITCVYNLRVQTTQDGKTNTGYFWTPDLGTCNGRDAGSLLKTDVMVGGYVDLGTWYGLTPYVGAGVGFARVDTWTNQNFYKDSDGTAYTADLTAGGGVPLIWRDTYGNIVRPTVPSTGNDVGFVPQNWARSTHQTKYNFAWSLMGGVAYAIDDHLSIDVGYRYINLGDYTDARGQNRSMDAQQVRVGVRYAID